MTTPPKNTTPEVRAPCYFHDRLKYWQNAKKLLLRIIGSPISPSEPQ